MSRKILIVVLVVSVGLACSKEGKQEKVLAKIGSKKITVKDLEDRYAAMPAFVKQQIDKPQGRSRLLKAMIDEEVIVREAKARGLDKTDEFKNEMERRQKEILTKLFYEKVIDAIAQPNDAEIQKYYEDHKDQFVEPAKASARHIVTKTEKEALEVKGKILAGMDFAEAARKYSIDAVTNQRGGVIPGEITREDMVPGLGYLPELVDAVFSMKPGEVGGPIKTEMGYHIIKVEAQRPQKQKNLEQVKEQIKSQIKISRQGAVRDSIIDNLKKKYKVVLFEGEDADLMGPEELFKKASEETNSRQKIKYYEMFLRKFPDNPKAYEAKFMIGFTLAEELRDYDNAEKVFKEFLEKYPENDLSDDARWMLENMRSGGEMPGRVGK